MKIVSLDLFHSNDQIAWVGSGGKTSLILSVCRELFEKAFVTTTTHLALAQAQLADLHLTFPDAKIELLGEAGGQITLLTKGVDPAFPEKLKGFLPSELSAFSQFCHEMNYPLFIEADGARQKPLKSPAAHEPQIPDFVNKVCVVLGLGGLHQKISDEKIHRPELFSEIIQKEGGQFVNPEDIFRYLTNEIGGLKSIPLKAEKILFLNQFDLLENKTEIAQMALRCRAFFDHVLITSIDPYSQELIVHAHFGKIACVLLAAGESKRFGSPKQLAILNGKTFIRMTIEKILQTTLFPVHVITGAFQELVSEEIKDFSGIQNIENPNWQSGQASSVSKGIASLPEDVEAVIFLLVDQPQIKIDSLNLLLISYAFSKHNIIAFRFNNEIRHPILFSKPLFSALVKISGQAGGRQLFESHPPQFIELNDSDQSLDFDRPEDLENYILRKGNFA
jgi:molybdenum cofactor cytidylyltransferase